MEEVPAGPGEPSIRPDGGISLDATVSEAVRVFLEADAEARARFSEGKDLSTSQRRKANAREKAERREARWKAKGIDAGQSGKRGVGGKRRRPGLER